MPVTVDAGLRPQLQQHDVVRAVAPGCPQARVGSGLRQQPPFLYVDAEVRSDLARRWSAFSLWLEAGQDRVCSDNGLPGFLLIEAMAQASGILLRRLSTGEAGGLLVGVDGAHLPEIVAFPSRLEIDTQLVGDAPHLFDFTARVTSRGACLAQARLRIASRRSLHA